jgi:hypothetical protein
MTGCRSDDYVAIPGRGSYIYIGHGTQICFGPTQSSILCVPGVLSAKGDYVHLTIHLLVVLQVRFCLLGAISAQPHRLSCLASLSARGNFTFFIDIQFRYS